MGKSATSNTILGKDHFHKAASSKSVTRQCSQATTIIEGKTIKVVDTPSWCDTELSEAELTQETVKCIEMLYPGPHVFLLVFAIGNRFTAKEEKSVKMIEDVFGEGATRYTMILLTRGDDLESQTIDSYLKWTPGLQALVSKFNGRYHVFKNKEKNHDQVPKLLQKMQDMVQHNGGECYTNSTYQLLEKYKKREADANKKEMQAREAEFKRRVQLMEQEQQHQRLRETEPQGQLSQIYTVNVMTTWLVQMQIDENARKERENERHEHRRRMESEMQIFQQKQEILKYEAKILKLKEQHRQAEAEREEMLRKQSRCITS